MKGDELLQLAMQPSLTDDHIAFRRKWSGFVVGTKLGTSGLHEKIAVMPAGKKIHLNALGTDQGGPGPRNHLRISTGVTFRF